MNLSKKPVLLSSVREADKDLNMERLFRSAPLVSQSVVESMDRVMAGNKTNETNGMSKETEKETSIYDALGWDDEEEDELL